MSLIKIHTYLVLQLKIIIFWTGGITGTEEKEIIMEFIFIVGSCKMDPKKKIKRQRYDEDQSCLPIVDVWIMIPVFLF